MLCEELLLRVSKLRAKRSDKGEVPQQVTVTLIQYLGQWKIMLSKFFSHRMGNTTTILQGKLISVGDNAIQSCFKYMYVNHSLQAQGK